MLNQYISEYCSGLEFRPCRHISKDIWDVRIEVDIWECNEDCFFSVRAQVTFSKEEMSYSCIFIDVHDWENCFYPLTFNGCQFICFRKTLYGFTLLNADTLQEEFDYFPAKVLEGEEAVIITDAKSFGDLIVFDGCYWGSPSCCFAFDYCSKQFAALSKSDSVELMNFAVLDDNTLVLTVLDENDKKAELLYTIEQIHMLLDKNGSLDF